MDKYQDIIEQYLDGTFNAEEQSAFENRLSQEPALLEALDQERQARNLITVAGRRDLKAKLEALENSRRESGARRRFLGPMLLVAASLVLLVMAGYWLIQLSGPAGSDQLFAQYFEVYQSPVQIRSGTVQQDNELENAIARYRSGEYSQFINSIQQINLEDPSIPAYLLQFYLGVAYLAREPSTPRLAIDAFDRVLDSTNDYQQQALWYQALAYLKLDETDRAKETLKQLLEKKDYREKEARALLETLL